MAAVDDILTQKAIDWLRNFLQREHGLWFTTCVKNPKTCEWFCYDQNGELVIKLTDEIVDRIFLAQERLEWLAPTMDNGDALQNDHCIVLDDDDDEDGA